MGYPESIHLFLWVFPYKSSIWGYPHDYGNPQLTADIWRFRMALKNHSLLELTTWMLGTEKRACWSTLANIMNCCTNKCCRYMLFNIRHLCIYEQLWTYTSIYNIQIEWWYGKRHGKGTMIPWISHHQGHEAHHGGPLSRVWRSSGFEN